MAHKKNRYDGACYYNGKLMGRCTVADAEAYTALMESCGNNASRVLREYAYFSDELKKVLEKVAGIQTGKKHSAPSR